MKIKRKIITTKNKYHNLIEKISEIVNKSRSQLARTINTTIVNTYWSIEKYIVEFEQKGKERADYGSELMKAISRELSAKLGKGFSRSNLQNMKLLYLNYPKSQTLSGKLSWSHHCLLLGISDKW
ncbi:hypothetical protein HYX00_01650 [Candidatus Woesearchaeota archaeon]|nr:hypothetical protein [Candidatus Woesearchaeota archaeon]